MSNLMLIAKSYEKVPSGGRGLLCKNNHDNLKKITGDNFRAFELRDEEKTRKIKKIVNLFNGYIDGISKLRLAELLNRISDENVKWVFIDGSNLGLMAKIIKRNFPHVKIITFFHNVEAKFFLGAFKSNKTVHSLGVLIANYIAEKKSVYYSDRIICLSNRDNLMLKKIYGRNATDIIPMTIADEFRTSNEIKVGCPLGKFALFVGGAFYANLMGIAWFVREVVPFIQIPIYIVGRGFDAYRAELEEEGKVIVVGGVDDLQYWYHSALFVIAPIFDGSGMKTKVAEALMYGKKIIGTSEAFSGYETVLPQAGFVCETANDFVKSIQYYQINLSCNFDINLRNLYLENYSIKSAQNELKRILNEEGCGVS